MKTPTPSSALLHPSIPDFSKLLEVCIDHLNDAIMITEAQPISDPGPRIIWVNKVFYERNGYTPEEVIGNTPRMLQGPDTDRATLDRVHAALAQWQPIRAETLNYRKDGTTYWNEFEMVPVANDQGEFTHWVSVQRDATARKQMEEQVHQLAFYDPMTNLANRRLLDDRLRQTMAASKRSGRYGALLFMDLDNFKSVNDTYGHEVGDLLLVKVAEQLKKCVREIDTVSRFGGDEFVVLLSDLDADKAASREQAAHIAEKIRFTISKPFLLRVERADHADSVIEHHGSASIGVVMFLNHQALQSDLLKWSDMAMYRAKEAGRNAIRFYEAADPA